jgi:hypothetical protein
MLGLGKKSQAPAESDITENLAGSQASLTWEKIDEDE